MELNNDDISKQIVFGDTVKATEKYDTTVKESFNPDTGVLRLVMGNSGFDFRYGTNQFGSQSRFDFLPEDKEGIIEERSGKYAFMFCGALRELRNWLNKKENLDKYGLRHPLLPVKLVSVNYDVINGMYTMFERHGNHEKLIRAYTEGFDMIFDLEGFVNLQDDDELIKFFDRASERAKDIEVTYSKDIQKQKDL